MPYHRPGWFPPFFVLFFAWLAAGGIGLHHDPLPTARDLRQLGTHQVRLVVPFTASPDDCPICDWQNGLSGADRPGFGIVPLGYPVPPSGPAAATHRIDRCALLPEGRAPPPSERIV